MQKANCDALGVGQRLKAHHYETWKTMDWKKLFPNIPIHADIKTEIIQQGLIN